jgi:hypothetical protein
MVNVEVSVNTKSGQEYINSFHFPHFGHSTHHLWGLDFSCWKEYSEKILFIAGDIQINVLKEFLHDMEPQCECKFSCLLVETNLWTLYHEW